MGSPKGGVPQPGPGSTASQGTLTSSGLSSSVSAGSQKQSPSPHAMDAYLGLFNSGNFLYNNLPYNPDMDQQVAPLTGQQQTSLQQMFDLGMDAGNFDPAKVRAIESPYTEDVVNATQGWFNNQNAIQGDSLLGNAIKSGNAFGGDRAGVAEAQLGGQQQLAQAPVIAGLRQAGYTQALDEYNKLKQFGLAGAQEAFQGASVWQQQQQRQMDAHRQNVIAQQAYGPELTNWYASLAGGLGPLMGSEAAATGATEGTTANTSTSTGVTTPPQPNPLVQGLGLASSAIGLGTSLLGGGASPGNKRGGLVRFSDGGGIGDRGPATEQLRKAMADRHEAWLIDQMSTQGRRAQDISDSFQPPMPRVGPFPRLADGGAVDNPGDHDRNTGADNNEETNILVDAGKAFMSTGPFGAPRIARPVNAANASLLSNQRPSTPTQAPTTPAPQQQQQSNSSSSGLGIFGDILGVAAKAAPLLLLRRGGSVPGLAGGGPIRLPRRYDDGGDVDFPPPVGDGWDENSVGVNWGTDQFKRVPRDQDEPDDASLIPVHAGLVQGDEPASGSPAGLPVDDMPGSIEPAASGSPAGLPEGDTPASAGAGLGGPPPPRRPTVSGSGTRTLPGLGRPPSTFASRAASSPFLSAGIAMLGSRSPYLGQGIGAGLAGAQGALARTARQEQLDAKPQMITHGDTVQFRVGDKMIDTGIRTQTAAQKAQREDRQLDRESREKISRERQEAITGRSGTPSKTEGGKLERERDAEVRRLMQMELNAAKNSGQDLGTDEAEYRAIRRWNKRNPERALPEPEIPAPKPAPAKPKEEPGIIQRGWDYLTKPDPTAPQTAPVTPGTTPPGVPEVKAPQAPDLKGALAAGRITPAEVLEQAKAKIAAAPSQREVIIKRLEDAHIDTTSLKLAPAMPVVPISQ